MSYYIHRFLDHGWEPNRPVRIDVAIEHGGRICYVRRQGIYRYRGYLSYFDIKLGGKRVQLGGDELTVPFKVVRLPRDAQCG